MGGRGPTSADVIILLIENAVPILTAMSALTAAIAACLAAWRGHQNARAILSVQDSADDAMVKAEKAALKVDGRIDALIESIRNEADLSIAAARREAERAVVHAQRNAQQMIASFQAERMLESRTSRED